MKLLKSIALLLTLVAILFAATTADSFAQLTKIWEVPNGGNLPIEAISPNAKIVHAGQFLIDLTNGNVITSVPAPNSFRLDYSGKRYFVENWQEKTMKVYDRYTKEFIQDLEYRLYPSGVIAANDSIMMSFEEKTHTLQFWNIYTNTLIDSFKIPNTPDIPTYTLVNSLSFSYDGRYFAFHFQKNTNAEYNYFMIYDRQTREIIMKKTLPANTGYGLIYQFMHTSNLLAYGEVAKLDGDIKPYSYIRIYDLDQRNVIRDIKVGNEENGLKNIVIRNDDNYLLFLTSPSNDVRIYNFQNHKLMEYSIKSITSPFFCDNNFIVTKSMKGYTFDWGAVGVKDDHTTNGDSIIYPNPTTNSINLLVEEKYFGGKWEITNLNGNVMLKGTIQSNPNLQINVGMLPAQNYFLRIQKDNFTVTYPVVKI